MTDAKWERLAAATGIVGAVIFAVQAFVVALPPKIEDPVDVVARYYLVHRIGVQWQVFLTGMAGVFLLWFLGSLRSHLRRAEGETGRLSAVAFGSAIAASGPVAAGALATSVLALEVGRFGGGQASFGGIAPPTAAAPLIRLLHDTRLMSYTLSWFALAPALAAVAVVSFRNGAFPRWHGNVSYALFFVAIVAGAGVFASNGVFAPGGVVNYAAFLLFLVWTAVTSRLLMLRLQPPDTAG